LKVRFSWPKVSISANNISGQNLYFYLNHPIRFVTLVGPVVSIDSVSAKFAIFTIDDGSGTTIDVIIARKAPETLSVVDCAPTTDVPYVSVGVGIGRLEIDVDGKILDIGTVVKAKGTISEFRSKRQLELKRISILRSTEEEVKAWEELASWKTTLSTPWFLSKDELKELEEKETREIADRQQLERAKMERARRRAERRSRRDSKDEKKRRIEEVVMNTGALV
jgi:hypothetical protein